MVRMWSIALRFLDRKGLGGAWREAIQCKAILEENRLTPAGYSVHPQLDRFRLSNQLHEPHINHHFNWYLHSLYHEAKFARGYNYNLNFIGPHHPYGCLDCSRLDTIEHAIYPLNKLHSATTYHKATPRYYPTDKYRYSLHYADTIVRDHVATCPIYSTLSTELYPIIQQTPRNVIEFANTNTLSETTRRIIHLESIPSPATLVDLTIPQQLTNRTPHTVPIFSTSTPSLLGSNQLSSMMMTSNELTFKIGRALNRPATVAPTTTTKAAKGTKRGKRATGEQDEPTDEKVIQRETINIEDTSLFAFSIPSSINKPIWAPPYTITWPNLQTQLNLLTSTHSASLPPLPAFRQELSSLFISPSSSIPASSSSSKLTQQANVVPDIQHQLLPHYPSPAVLHPNADKLIINSTKKLPPASSKTKPDTKHKNDNDEDGDISSAILDYWNTIPISYKSIPVTLGQVLYEWKHILTRMESDGRDKAHSQVLQDIFIDINYHTRVDHPQDDQITDQSTPDKTTKGKKTSNSTSIPSNNDSKTINQGTYQMDPTLLHSYNTPNFESHEKILRDDQLYHEKHPYITHFDTYGLPSWIDVHNPQHTEAFTEFGSNVPQILKGKELDCTIPGFHPLSQPSSPALSLSPLSSESASAVADKGTSGTKRKGRQTLDGDSTITQTTTTSMTTDDAKPKRQRRSAKTTSTADDPNEDAVQLNSPIKPPSSPTSAAANTRLSKSKDATTLYTSQKSSLSQIKLVSTLPDDAKVLHINDIIHPMFYVVDGDIEYTEVVGEYDLGELKLFKGM